MECPLCYNLTNSLPGYTLDPNNCAKFYSCVKYGDQWLAHHMDCSECSFWDQDKLTCVQVVDSCLTSVSVATDPGVTAQGEYDYFYYMIKHYMTTLTTYRSVCLANITLVSIAVLLSCICCLAELDFGLDIATMEHTNLLQPWNIFNIYSNHGTYLIYIGPI